MRKSRAPTTELANAAEAVEELNQRLAKLNRAVIEKSLGSREHKRFLQNGGKSLAELERVLKLMAPQRFGSVDITLGRADSIAKFFAFSFIASEKLSLEEVSNNPFWGSGVYAIYYRGKRVSAYTPISQTETPIYVGMSAPTNAFAETIEAQGQSLFRRLKQHAKNIAKTGLPLSDFTYRAATIQSGMQASVEEFMIRLFRPIWNKDVGVCHGLGKHGDSAKTRANKRSPWDTMHPGRKWAAKTLRNQKERHEIVSRIALHFKTHPVITNKRILLKRLSLR